MAHNFDYNKIMETYNNAASPVAANGAFDLVRTSLKDGHEVQINFGEGQQSKRFTKIEDFNKWVADIKERI
ncbi:hypothetical protein [Marivirga arenosa]|uniref:Uncharacterized protein n=1 Tax=Marivirga arenosa TaxID=3059076 RepID=A0AA49JHG5_9BACT|nr:hypothetical protein [Marivirga sp. BKB1-2]WKK80392.1 hypothetical protein QYS47_25070 [Marivirga sp. BKB1-2]WKK80403.1 hypothetical protein QYS47_25135 [Marivirga sp. BKB1-2]WKK80415.1 hypothetical protein QYS47_25200 [Marivirga sp. BKB1-2]WKK80427.1 hypothetical protein QYS47_25270 [Marivirga sp. BKB1-2]